MTPSARAHSAIEALEAVFITPRPADVVLGEFFRARRYMGAKDRGVVAELVYDVLRHHARLGWWLTKAGWQDTARARVALWLAFGGHNLAGLFTGQQYAPESLTDGEKKFLSSLPLELEAEAMPELVKLECPDWATHQLKLTLGTSFAEELRALQLSAPVDVRVNPLKTNREELQRVLRDAGIPTQPTPHSALGLRAEGRPALGGLVAFKEGLFEVQDEGSQLVAELVGAKAGEQVVDFCAGAGGKTLAIAAAMNNKGRVIACDVEGKRLKRAAERFRRAGLYNIETRELSSEADAWVKRHKGGFARVLVDAPCTGTGVWRRNPDARWRQLGPGLESLVPLQAKILASAARLVKPGGVLVYATCSLLRIENEGQAETFLAAHPEFTHDKTLALSPAKDGTDGFYGVRLIRKA